MNRDPPSIHISLFGPLQVLRDGSPVNGFRSRKVVALLGYLLEERRPFSRLHLVSLLWGESPEKAARANLRWALHILNTQLPGCFTIDREQAYFTPGEPIVLDTDILARARNGDMPSLVRAFDAYRGEFLSGLSLPDCPDYEVWLLVTRNAWKQRYVQTANTLVRHLIADAELSQALEYATQALKMLPEQEDFHRLRMQALALNRQRYAALEQFHLCRQILEQSLETEPSQETIALYRAIEAGDIPPL